MKTRDESLSQISDTVTPEIFAKILEKNFSDKTLDLISAAPTVVETFAKSKYSTASIETLIDAMDSFLINRLDVVNIVQSSVATNHNEKDMDAFLVAIRRGMSPNFAVNAFVAANTDNMSFERASELISSGIYTTRNIGMVLTQDMAWELHDLGMTLTADAVDYKYTVEDVAKSYGLGHFIKFPDDRLAVEISKLKQTAGWAAFREYLKKQLVGEMDKLTPYILDSMVQKYKTELSMNALSDKVMGEYEHFIADIKTQSPDKIVAAAYEIVQKDNIADMFNFSAPELSKEDIDILHESDNALDRIYKSYFELTREHGFVELETAVEDAAYNLKMEKAERQRAQELAAKQQKPISINKPTPNMNTISNQQAKSIKHKGR